MAGGSTYQLPPWIILFFDLENLIYPINTYGVLQDARIRGTQSCTRMWANIRTNEIWVQLSENQLSVGGNKMLK